MSFEDIKYKVFEKHQGELTAKRILNYIKIKASAKARDPKVWGMPSSLFIEPTNLCNVECPLCPTGNKWAKRPKGYMKFEEFKQIIDEAGDTLLNVTLWNYGEPFLNKDVFKMIKYARDKGIHVISSTNGYGIRNKEYVENVFSSGLNHLIVALDGADQKTLEIYRVNAKFDEMINGLRLIRDIKRKTGAKLPHIELQFIVMKHNEHQIEEIKKIAKEMEVEELFLKTVNIYEGSGMYDSLIMAERFMPGTEEYRRYYVEANGLVNKQPIKNECEGIWIGMNINWNGNVTACCYDLDEWITFGNIFKDGGVKKIWNNPKYVEFRRIILSNKKQTPMCARCPTNYGCRDKRITQEDLVHITA